MTNTSTEEIPYNADKLKWLSPKPSRCLVYLYDGLYRRPHIETSQHARISFKNIKGSIQDEEICIEIDQNALFQYQMK